MLKRLSLISLFAALATASAFGQMSGLAVFEAPLSPSSEVPPVVGANMAGNATVLIHMTRNSSGALTQAVVDFHINASTETPETLVAMHIHRAARGANGGVVIDSEFGAAIEATGPLQLFRHTVLTETEALDIVEEILANPAGFYVNIHSQSNPPGLVRGQLMRTNGAAISSLRQEVEQLRQQNAAMTEQMERLGQTLSRVARRFGVVPAE